MHAFFSRYALNYKGIPYKTEWVEYPNIEPLCIKYGALPTDTKSDGRPHYTLPMIYDPSTKTALAESREIAKYLDKTYPETPRLFPEGTQALQVAFLDGVWASIGYPLFMNIIHRTCTSLNPPSQTYFRETREAMFGKKLEELGGDGDWQSLEAGLGKLDAWLRENGPGKDLLLLGDRVCFSDLQIASLLIWARIICGEDSADWQRIAGWHDGRWKRLVEYFDDHATVDDV